MDEFLFYFLNDIYYTATEYPKPYPLVFGIILYVHKVLPDFYGTLIVQKGARLFKHTASYK